MSSDAMLGTEPVGDSRDAVHVAIVPAIAGEWLTPGSDVTLIDGKAHRTERGVGIVDPFLRCEVVHPGVRFWLCLHPGTVTGMRHHWQHPDFSDGSPLPEVVADPNTAIIGGEVYTKEESLSWIKDYCDKADCPEHEILMAAALGDAIPNYSGMDWGPSYEIDDEYLYFRDADAHGDIPPELWDHIENATGRKCEDRPPRYSCSC